MVLSTIGPEMVAAALAPTSCYSAAEDHQELLYEADYNGELCGMTCNQVVRPFLLRDTLTQNN